MKFEQSKDKGDPSVDSACYRKFLAGSRTLYTKAFWENGPRRSVAPTELKPDAPIDKLIPGVENTSN